jgi:hypothetical protein
MINLIILPDLIIVVYRTDSVLNELETFIYRFHSPSLTQEHHSGRDSHSGDWVVAPTQNILHHTTVQVSDRHTELYNKTETLTRHLGSIRATTS